MQSFVLMKCEDFLREEMRKNMTTRSTTVVRLHSRPWRWIIDGWTKVVAAWSWLYRKIKGKSGPLSRSEEKDRRKVLIQKQKDSDDPSWRG